MPGSMSSSDPPLARDAANTAMKPASPVVGLPRMATLPLYSEPSSSSKLVGHFFTASVSQPMAIVPPRRSEERRVGKESRSRRAGDGTDEEKQVSTESMSRAREHEERDW